MSLSGYMMQGHPSHISSDLLWEAVKPTPMQTEERVCSPGSAFNIKCTQPSEMPISVHACEHILSLSTFLKLIYDFEDLLVKPYYSAEEISTNR